MEVSSYVSIQEDRRDHLLVMSFTSLPDGLYDILQGYSQHRENGGNQLKFKNLGKFRGNTGNFIFEILLVSCITSLFNW